MIEIRSAIAFMAVTVSTTALPLSSASRAPFSAICSVRRLLSAFWLMEALIAWNDCAEAYMWSANIIEGRDHAEMLMSEPAQVLDGGQEAGLEDT